MEFLRGLRIGIAARSAFSPIFILLSAWKAFVLSGISTTESQLSIPASRVLRTYYYRAASTRVAHGIAVPTLAIHSVDDPFIRMLPETRDTLLANPNVTLVETKHGGHCAFLASANGYDGYWAERALLHS